MGDVPAGPLTVLPVVGMGEVVAGDDVAALVLDALAAAGERLQDGDVVVVSSKVVSKAEGRVLAADTRDGAVEAETVRIVAERSGPRGTTRVVRSRSGPVLAAAGVDNSNVAPGTVLLLPADPDTSARRLRAALVAATGTAVGVLVSDTAGRAWRDGQVDLAIGAAGVRVTDDLRGGTDPYGNPLEVTVRALADELAAAADLVKGKVAGVPAAVVRGLPDVVLAPAPDGREGAGHGSGPGAAALLRGPGGDWFALGHVEAVRSALGVPPGTPGVPPAPLVPDGATARLQRAATVALAAPDPFGAAPGRIRLDAGTADAVATALVDGPDGPGTGALVQRLLAAAWAEDLDAAVEPAGPSGWRVSARARPPS